MRPGALVLSALLGVAGALPAHADPLDEFGFGARASGMAGAYAAAARGADAAHHNPAAVSLAEHPAVMVGYSYGAMGLSINGEDARVLDAHGGTLGLVIPIDFSNMTAAFGMALYLPDQFLARIQLIPAAEPRFILLDNNPHRIVVEPVASLRIGDYFAVGAGVSVLTDVTANGITFNVGVTSGEKVGESAVDAGLPLRLAPLIGVLITPTPRVSAGLTYRGAIAVDLALDILANVDVANVVTGDALVSIRAGNYYTPQQVTGGVAVDALPDLTLSAEATWIDYSEHPSGVADLRILVGLDTAPPLVDSEVPPAEFQDIVTLRFGAEWRFGGSRTHYAARTGYAYFPTPVPEQVGLTSFADNDRHVMACGFGVTLADWKPTLTRPVEISIAAQWHHLSDRTTVKDAERYPGEPFSSRGNIFYLGSSMRVNF